MRPAADDDRYRLTSCYAAGRCQGDLCCPLAPSCHRIPGIEPDDGYDD